MAGSFRLPYIMQAPIGSLATVELVTNVSESGGLGTLALSWTEPAMAAKLVKQVKARTSAAFAANFVLSFEPLALTAALEAGVPVVTFSWGLPGPLVKTVHSFGAAVGVQVGTIEGARCALDSGCDFVICQGIEAGGHVQSSTPLRALLPRVTDYVRTIPICAAGGLTDRSDIEEVVSLGARAAMLGTRFVASTESRAHPAYKAALLAADSRDTVVTGCFDGDWPYALHRVLRNTTLLTWETAGCPPTGRRPGDGDVVATRKSGTSVRRYDDAPPDADMQGDVLACCLYAGAGVGKITGIQSARELVRDLSAGFSRDQA